MKTQLLCTFTTPNYVAGTVNKITNHYTVVFNRIFILVNEDDEDELLCTYNIEQAGYTQNLDSTISLHRKKTTNTLYTINALNALIKQLNNGVLDQSYQIPWNNYQNTVILYGESGLRQIPTAIQEIVNLN